MSAAKEIVQEEMKLINQLMNSMLVVWMLLCTLALTFTLLRAELTGWGSKENVLIFLFLIMCLVTIFRHKILPWVKVLTFVVTLLLVAILGVLEFGLMAPGIMFLPMTAFLLSLFYKQQVVYIFAGLILCFMVWVGFAFQTGYLTLSADANLIFNSVSHWVVYVVCLASLLLLVPISVIKYKALMDHLFSEIKQQKKEIEHLANHDFLTGMPLIKLYMNKFESIVQRGIHADKCLALLFLDIDKFKLILDQYGHDAGDVCLIHVSNKLNTAIKKDGFACRLGGDEFMVLLNNMDDETAVFKKAERIVSEVSSSFVFRGQQLSVGLSIGIAVYGKQGVKFNELKRAADRAMYQAKLSSDASVCLAD